MDACEALRGYARLVALARKNRRAGMGLADAVGASVAQCIDEGVLASYLVAHRAEVEDMLFTIQDEERAMRVHREAVEREAREKGLAEGLAEGRAEGLAEGRAEGRAEGLAEGRAEGLAEGRAEGRADALSESVRNLVSSLGCSVQEAMDMLGIPEEDRQNM